MDKKKIIYVFGVSLDNGLYDQDKNKQRVYREIAIKSTQSLSTLACVIVSSFGFNFDHCYGFYDNLKNSFDSKEIYELFTDMGEDPTEGALGVEHVRVSKAFNKLGKKLLFLFDYGDNWHFTIELLKIKEVDNNSKYPNIIKRIGKAPEQYPPLDDVQNNLKGANGSGWYYHDNCKICRKLRKDGVKLNWHPDN